jgi:cyanophycin synthetase
MRILAIRTLAGPNVYNHNPVLVMRLDLEDLVETSSAMIEGFTDRLLTLLPGLEEHHCSLERPGGFHQRLREGTYPAHIIEHVTLELSQIAGIPVSFGKARWSGPEPGVYNVVVRYKAEHGMRHLLATAVALVGAVIDGRPFPLEEKIRETKRIVAETELGVSTRAIVQAAEERGIPWKRPDDQSLLQLGWGKCRRYVQAAVTDRTSAIGVEIAGNKELAKALLSAASIPVPRGIVVRTEEEAVAALARLGAPVVVKPIDGRRGRGVSLDVESGSEAVEAFRIAREYAREVLVEERLTGKNYRVLVVGGRVVAATERVPCHVTGDGIHTVRELIAVANHDPLRGDDHEKPLTTIKIDPILLAHLDKKSMTLEDVPPARSEVSLCAGMNISTGGTARDVTDAIHPSYASLCRHAADVAGMDICGVDLIAPDIAKEYTGGAGGIIELNAAPGLRMHLHPTEGKPRDVGRAIVDMMFPRGSNGRIPVFAITGTNGKTTVTRMIGHILSLAGRAVGMTTTDGIYLKGERIARGDMTGPASAGTILGSRDVEVAVLETARGGIVRRGLGFDWCDVGVMTTIQPDHIGQDGIEDVEDILHIKSLVAERVREGGTLVLNADDDLLVRLAGEPAITRRSKRIVFFSLHAENPVIERHRSDRSGEHTVYFVRNGTIIEATGAGELAIVEVEKMPATLGGAARFQVANAMAAIAACRAHGISPEDCARGLALFSSDANNPGRINLYRVGNGYVVVDYGHNPDAIGEICTMASHWTGRRITGVIGLPGDRADSVVIDAGRVAANGFDRIIIKEDHDLRGRSAGEIASLLCDTIRSASPTTECRVVHDEIEALDRAISEMTDGEIVVVFYEKLDPVLDLLRRRGAVPATMIERMPEALEEKAA